MDDRFKQFFAADKFAVAGASIHPHKYGNKVFRALLNSGRDVVPINPNAGEVEGIASYASLHDLPEVPQSLSIITPPAITRGIISDAIALGVANIWMQPGAEDFDASEAARERGINVIDDGSCLLVLIGGYS